jgi:dihydropyrimidine dehydrogenase (NAD+) subunit PreA
MADLSTNFLGIKSPNPFWLASAPPTDKAYNVERAFEAGWGGVVWKTLGEAGPPVVNVNGPRYGAIWGPDRRLLGLNNIELITDRDLEVNLREIKGEEALARPGHDRVDHGALRGGKLEGDPATRRGHRRRRHRAEFRLSARHERARHGIGRRPGARIHPDGRPNGASSTRSMPVIVKLTPNITDIRYPARAAKAGGADAVSLINTISSITRSISTISRPCRRSTARARMAAIAARRSSRSRSTWWPKSPVTRNARPADFRHWRRDRPGVMRPSSSHWAAAPFRSAPRP